MQKMKDSYCEMQQLSNNINNTPLDIKESSLNRDDQSLNLEN